MFDCGDGIFGVILSTLLSPDMSLAVSMEKLDLSLIRQYFIPEQSRLLEIDWQTLDNPSRAWASAEGSF